MILYCNHDSFILSCKILCSGEILCILVQLIVTLFVIIMCLSFYNGIILFTFEAILFIITRFVILIWWCFNEFIIILFDHIKLFASLLRWDSLHICLGYHYTLCNINMSELIREINIYFWPYITLCFFDKVRLFVC